MGDRKNPIKFGPEWLRNLAQEPANTGAQGGPRDVGAAATSASGASAPRPHAANPSNNSPKVLLARLRYGREEMLALYDRQTAEAPALLKTNDTLYQPRGKPPYALNNSFEEDNRDSVSRQPPATGLLSPSDRYTGAGRGRSVTLNDTKPRVIQLNDLRGKARGYMRPNPSLQQRGWHGRVGGTYSGIPDDDPNQPLRTWSNNNHQTSSGLRPNNGEQPDWQTKQAQYRMKRQTSTNWRQQQGRDEGEEWRSPDGSRRPQEKWADWGWQQEAGGRPTQDKQWHSNRRTWVGGESSEDALPEWAVDNAEACAGTFDSSGAFHGYSNDDSNLPKNQETSYPLMKSHTHGSFVRTKTAEEGSEEWWASEKAKKLSPKRFDASEIQFKKPLSPNNADEKSNSNTAAPKNTGPNDQGNQNQGTYSKRTYQTIAAAADKKPKENKSAKTGSKAEDEDSPETKHTVSESENYNKTDDAKEKMFESRSNTDKPKEKGNIQSVILTSNNTLRQKHQNITVTPTETPKRQPKLMSYLETVNQPRQIESDVGEFENRKDADSNKIVEDILQMSLDDGIPSATINQLLTSHSNSSMNSLAQTTYNSLHMRMAGGLQGLGMNLQNIQNAQLSSGMPTPEAYNGMMQPMCITNSMLNASLGLPMPDSNSGLPQGLPQSLSNTGLTNQNTLASGLQGMGGGNLQQSGIQQPGLQGTGMQSSQMSSLQGLHMQGLQGFGIQPTASIQNNLSGMPNNNNMQGTGHGPGLQSTTNQMSGVGNSALFNNMAHANNQPNTGGDNVQTLHRFPQFPASPSQSYGNMMYGANMLNHPPPPINMAMKQRMSDQWYYEDPNKTIQGPFSSKDMYNWYRAGFFSPTLMVRRERDAVMSPLGSYGPLPFGPIDLLTPYSMGGGYDLMPQQSHENMMNQQPGLGVDGLPSKGPLRQSLQIARNIQYKPRSARNIHTQAAVKSCGPIIRPRVELHIQTPLQLVQNNEVQSLWEQPTNNAPAPDMMWMPMNNNNPRNDSSMNDRSMHFWNIEGSDVAAAPLMPESIKTEEEILAQMRAAQAQGPTSPLSFFAESPIAPQEAEANNANARLNINQLQKLIQKDAAAAAAAAASDTTESEPQVLEKTTKSIDVPAAKGNKTNEIKTAKEVAKTENNKQKIKESKPKSKKAKDDKKEEPEIKAKEEEMKIEKRSAEPSPSPKNKKEDKASKKDLDKEKKEWIKEGFTIVKGAEKTKDKDSKKKAEEAKAAEETERKRKEEEKLAAEEKKRQLEAIKKQETQNQAPASRHAVESVSKKAPWSASSQSLPSSNEGPTLAEIQRLEREKKLEQMKEQQQMMQAMAQKEAAALAKEQELQAGLGWAKKPNTAAPSPTLAEIQAEARKQAVAAAAAAAAAVVPREEVPTPPPANTMPWANVHNGGDGYITGGFWDSPNPEPVKPVAKQPEPKPEPKNKKKVTVMAPPKQENTPSVEFDMWCSNMLVSWRDTGIDVPTFVSFLRDIESPYEVKDYVKCYLGDSRESGDFARQFLEKRSRLMRVGMVTPSDDLCSPAVAVNPRTISGSDHADLKAKGKKTKKNKMLKVDARNILGFSVTASEDRINVGDIDTV